MPNLINQSFFVGDLVIPNLASNSNVSPLERLNTFITKFEPKCLLLILGYPLFKVFNTESSQRMTDLLSGIEYTSRWNNELTYWQGLVHDDNLSLIANFIYFKFQESQKEQTTGISVKVDKPEKGFAISPADKMTSAWNQFSEEVKSMCYFLRSQKNPDGTQVYPEFSEWQYNETLRVTRKIDSIFSF